MDIIENNKIIAEFMEFDFNRFKNDGVIVSKQGSFFNSLSYSFSLDEFKFHSDWNWLMEVVEKISEYRLAYPKEANKVCNLKVVIYKHALYNACLEFIKWYNDQQNN